MEGRQLANYAIGRRIADKARAPLATDAKNALRKATAKLVKKHGGDSGCVTAYTAEGEQINGGQASELLQRGMAITLRLHLAVREVVSLGRSG